jgi:hypothetical protein
MKRRKGKQYINDCGIPCKNLSKVPVGRLSHFLTKVCKILFNLFKKNCLDIYYQQENWSTFGLILKNYKILFSLVFLWTWGKKRLDWTDFLDVFELILKIYVLFWEKNNILVNIWKAHSIRYTHNGLMRP